MLFQNKVSRLGGVCFQSDCLLSADVVLFQMTVEVERKFVFSAETLETLENIGGKWYLLDRPRIFPLTAALLPG